MRCSGGASPQSQERGDTSPAPVEFAEFGRRHRPRLVAYLRRKYPRLDAEDVAQEALIRAWTQIGNVGPPQYPDRWLKLVASRIVIDEVRGRQPLSLSLDELASLEVPVDGDEPAEQVAAREQVGWLGAVLRSSPVQERLLVQTMLRDGLTCAAAARSLGVRAGTARQQLSRFRQRAESAFAAHGGRLSAVPLALWRVLRRPRARGSLPAGSMAAGGSAVVLAGLLIGVAVLDQPSPKLPSRIATLPAPVVAPPVGSATLTGPIHPVRPAAASASLVPPAGIGWATRPSQGGSPPGQRQVQVAVARKPLSKGRTVSVEVKVPTPAGTYWLTVYDNKSGPVCQALPQAFPACQ